MKGQEGELVELLVIHARQETRDQQRSRGVLRISAGFVYTRDPVTDSRGERENESG